jgi:iron complex transport system ATP-binding protein
MNLEIKDIASGYGRKTIIKDITFEVSTGEALCLLGPNGVGKTTLFKTILGFIKPKKGSILLNGTSIFDYSSKDLAKLIGYVPQAHNPPFPFKVIDVVLMGRTAYLNNFSSPSKKDCQIAEEAMETLNITYLKDKIYTEISGGEKQLVLIARALAQEPKILIMDEPTSNLDYGNQIRVLEHINKLVKNGLGLIMTSHFPNHVFLCASKVVVIKNGRLFSKGKPEEVLTENNLTYIYGVDTKIIDVSVSKNQTSSFCVPLLN